MVTSWAGSSKQNWVMSPLPVSLTHASPVSRQPNSSVLVSAPFLNV